VSSTLPPQPARRQPGLAQPHVRYHLYLSNVSVPLLGTGLVQTPEISGLRSIPNFIFFLLCFYFGFIKKPKETSK